MLLRRKASQASLELEGLVSKICQTARDRLRGWNATNRSGRYFISLTEEYEVTAWNGSVSQKVDEDLRLVLDLDFEDYNKIEGIFPNDMVVPFTKSQKTRIGEAFLTGCVRLATEPLDVELAVEQAIPEIEGWIDGE